MKPLHLRLSQAITGFLLEKEAAGKSPHTLRNYRGTFAKVEAFLVARGYGDPLLQEISREIWVEFLAWLQEQPLGGAAARSGRLSAKTVCNVHTDLSALYTWATRLGYTEEHHLKSIERPEYDRPAIETFTREEVTALLRACDYVQQAVGSGDGRHTVRRRRPTAIRDRAIIKLLLSSGIRASELCSARLTDLDLKRRQLRVAGKGKGRDSKVRLVFFGTRTQRALWRYLTEFSEERPETARVFVVDFENPRPMNRGVLRKMLLRTGQRAGLSGVHPHRFRHTFAVNYLRNGGDVLTLQAILGHTDLRMVKHYAHVAAQDCEAVHQRADPVDTWGL
ncbi:MAG: tyrosine-type recombinase/integrase [Anaerolineae bacterium]|nr:tyrosine-type recombinase/integrase [Anaerolineae bacterium]